MKLVRSLRVRPGRRFRIGDVDPDDTPGIGNKEQGKALLERNLTRIDELQYDLFAEAQRSLLLVFQAMDAGGKDGTIRSLAPALNPQGCRVTSFKVPSALEASHDFLWRIHEAAPPRGQIGIFNRSHYEDVLVVRVHDLVPKQVWSTRYDAINEFERYLSEQGTTIVKIFLHIGKDEQKRRFQERLDDPRKHWKFSPHDIEERVHWNAYMKAYETAVERCSTAWSPWYVVPANRNWYRNAAVSQILLETLEEMAPRPPKPAVDLSKVEIP